MEKINGSIKSDIVPDLNKIMSLDNDEGYVRKMKKINTKLQKLEKVFSEFSDSCTREELLKVKTEAEKWICEQKRLFLQGLQETVEGWKNKGEAEEETVANFLKDLKEYFLVNSYSEV